MNQKDNHHEMSTETIKRQMLKAKEGDEVLFNQRKRPLTVIRTYDPQYWVTVHVETPDEVKTVWKHKSKIQDIKKGYEGTVKSDYKFSNSEISGRVLKINSIESKYFDEHTLDVEGPRNGVYVLHVPNDSLRSNQYQHEERVAARNITAYRSSDETIYWFEIVDSTPQ